MIASAVYPPSYRTERALTVGTRGSALARWQAEQVIALLQHAVPNLSISMRIIKTAGDRDQVRPLAEFGGLGVFTTEIEHALLAGEIDLAVHSLKDLPVAESDALSIAAILPREDARDVIVSRHGADLRKTASGTALPPGARVGTSSARRTAQVLSMRPDAKIVPLRGNVDTRLRKAASPEYDAIVIAAAGLLRLGRADEITSYLELDEFLPDPGQGAMAVQIRSADVELAALVKTLDHAPTRAAVTSERAFLAALGGGCRMPMGAYAELAGETLHLRGMVGALDGTRIVRGDLRGPVNEAAQLGRSLAAQLLQNGAAEILKIKVQPAPLRGKRIVVTRAREQANELADKLRALGGESVEMPAIEFAPLDDYRALDDALARVGEFDWVVFTSANGVRAAAERLRAVGSNPEHFQTVRVAAIGPGTAGTLESLGVPVAFIPTKFLGEQIARELPIEVGQRALLLRADIASPVLAEGLRARGVTVTDVDAYRTVMPAANKMDLSTVDAVTFTSSSTVRNFVAMLDDDGRDALTRCAIFCIGPVTAETARASGLQVSAVADDHTLEGLVTAIVNFYERKEPPC